MSPSMTVWLTDVFLIIFNNGGLRQKGTSYIRLGHTDNTYYHYHLLLVWVFCRWWKKVVSFLFSLHCMLGQAGQETPSVKYGGITLVPVSLPQTWGWCWQGPASAAEPSATRVLRHWRCPQYRPPAPQTPWPSRLCHRQLQWKVNYNTRKTRGCASHVKMKRISPDGRQISGRSKPAYSCELETTSLFHATAWTLCLRVNTKSRTHPLLWSHHPLGPLWPGRWGWTRETHILWEEQKKNDRTSFIMSATDNSDTPPLYRTSQQKQSKTTSPKVVHKLNILGSNTSHASWSSADSSKYQRLLDFKRVNPFELSPPLSSQLFSFVIHYTAVE